MYFNILGGDNETSRKFLAHLKDAYKSCTESSSDAVTVSSLANEFMKTHSEADYKKFLKGRKLKAVLTQSSDFFVEGIRVTICTGNIFRTVKVNNYIVQC